MSDEEWEILTADVYPKLLRDKKVVVQGSGKVGGSLLQELKAFDVDIIAVADAGGAVIGSHLDADDLMRSVIDTANNPDRGLRSSIMGAEKNVKKMIFGAREGSAVLELECDILVPAALENAISIHNADMIRARIIACGSNGPNTSKAEMVLHKRGIIVIYDFLANQGGVNASYFEWLRNLTERFRYEAEEIYGKVFDPDVLDEYLMPEFRERIKRILQEEESPTTTREWNKLLRDINFAAINEDFAFAAENGISMKTAGYVNTQLRLLAAYLLKASEQDRKQVWNGLDGRVRKHLEPFMKHPEALMHNRDAEAVVKGLFPS
ncbi:hypothetical protein EG833_04060 [archaeon]|nr:hypothetical protein [archaeon]